MYDVCRQLYSTVSSHFQKHPDRVVGQRHRVLSVVVLAILYKKRLLLEPVSDVPVGMKRRPVRWHLEHRHLLHHIQPHHHWWHRAEWHQQDRKQWQWPLLRQVSRIRRLNKFIIYYVFKTFLIFICENELTLSKRGT